MGASLFVAADTKCWTDKMAVIEILANGRKLNLHLNANFSIQPTKYSL
jgi:hypothetical protein